MKKLLLLIALFAQSTFGAIVGPLPFTISSGQQIQANPLQSNYNWLLNQVNANAAPLASPALTGIPTVNGTTIFSSGSFTGTITGCTTAPTVTINWYKVGNLVTIAIPAYTGGISLTSNSSAFTITGGPAGIGTSGSWSSNHGPILSHVSAMDNGAVVQAGAWVDSTGTIIFEKYGVATDGSAPPGGSLIGKAWTASGGKVWGADGFLSNSGVSFSYVIY